MPLWLVVLIGLLGGAAVGVQGPLAGAMGQRVGGVASSFIIHVGGAIFSGLFLLLRGGEKIRDWAALPWYMLAAGIFGLVLYLTINITLPRLGGATMVALIIVGQLLVGVIVDHFGLLGDAIRHVDLPRLLGLALLVAGAYFVAR